jgi:hypothetical protein
MIHPLQFFLFEKSVAPSPWSGDSFDHLSAAGVIMVIALSLTVAAHFYSNRIPSSSSPFLSAVGVSRRARRKGVRFRSESARSSGFPS